MALTNFSNLHTEQKKVWSRDVWKNARNASFLFKFAGTSHNSMVHRITELTKSERGDQAVIHLVPDLVGDGVAGDATLEGNEEEIKSYDQVITIDQLRHANRHKGKMEHQKTVINFRNQSKDVLGYWLGDRIDQMAFLALSGISFDTRNNGAARGAEQGTALADLAFASDVTAPTAARHRRWNGTTKTLEAGDTTTIEATDTPSYAMLVEAKAYAKEEFIRGIKSSGNEEYYHVFMSPTGMARLRLDPDYLANVRHAGVRGSKNELFSGAGVVTQDGLIIHEFRHVYNTRGATTGVGKWGAGSDVEGQRVIMCGAQALGWADLGMPEWVEDDFDYGNQQGISIGKIFGMLKPKWASVNNSAAVEDFAVLCIDTAI
jgi:N4-gp56 family major capsid protein